MCVFPCLDVTLVLWLFSLLFVCLLRLFCFLFYFLLFGFLLFCFIIIFLHDFREIGRKSVVLGRWANADKLVGFGGEKTVIRIHSMKRKHILNKNNFKASLSIFKKLIYCIFIHLWVDACECMEVKGIFFSSIMRVLAIEFRFQAL